MTEHESKKDKSKEVEPDKVILSREEHEELLKKTQQLSELQERLLRSAADYENAKKRMTKERDDFLKFALESTILDLLPILDNLERALLHSSGSAEDDKIKSLRSGFSLIHKQLGQTLKERGLKRLEALGKPFDPHTQEAIAHIVSTDKAEGIVLEEIVPGYELNGKLIRPAQVKISSKHPDAEIQEKIEEIT